MQFVRTGETKYFRLAMQVARHQAGVDIVNALDPYYIGANHHIRSDIRDNGRNTIIGYLDT